MPCLVSSFLHVLLNIMVCVCLILWWWMSFAQHVHCLSLECLLLPFACPFLFIINLFLVLLLVAFLCLLAVAFHPVLLLEFHSVDKDDDCVLHSTPTTSRPSQLLFRYAASSAFCPCHAALPVGMYACTQSMLGHKCGH